MSDSDDSRYDMEEEQRRVELEMGMYVRNEHSVGVEDKGSDKNGEQNLVVGSSDSISKSRAKEKVRGFPVKRRRTSHGRTPVRYWAHQEASVGQDQRALIGAQREKAYETGVECFYCHKRGHENFACPKKMRDRALETSSGCDIALDLVSSSSSSPLQNTTTTVTPAVAHSLEKEQAANVESALALDSSQQTQSSQTHSKQEPHSKKTPRKTSGVLKSTRWTFSDSDSDSCGIVDDFETSRVVSSERHQVNVLEAKDGSGLVTCCNCGGEGHISRLCAKPNMVTMANRYPINEKTSVARNKGRGRAVLSGLKHAVVNGAQTLSNALSRLQDGFGGQKKNRKRKRSAGESPMLGPGSESMRKPHPKKKDKKDLKKEKRKRLKASKRKREQSERGKKRRPADS